MDSELIFWTVSAVIAVVGFIVMWCLAQKYGDNPEDYVDRKYLEGLE